MWIPLQPHQSLSHQKCSRDPVSLCPTNTQLYPALHFFHFHRCKAIYLVLLICISLITNDFKHLFTCTFFYQLLICIFAHFLLELLSVLLPLTYGSNFVIRHSLVTFRLQIFHLVNYYFCFVFLLIKKNFLIWCNQINEFYDMLDVYGVLRCPFQIRGQVNP